MDSGRVRRARTRRSIADTNTNTITGWCSGRKALRALRVDEWVDGFQRRRTGVCGESVYPMRDFWGRHAPCRSWRISLQINRVGELAAHGSLVQVPQCVACDYCRECGIFHRFEGCSSAMRSPQ